MAEIHDQAKKDYMKGMKYKDLAEKYQVTINTVKSWKQRYGWERKNKKGVHTKTEKGAHKKRGAPYGNRNSVGNKGGTGAPKGNRNAVKHGLFAKIFPDDEETRAIIEEIQVKSPLEILWEQIVIQYTAIARAQKLMFVKDQEDLTVYLKRERRGKNPEEEYELQFAWDKHANFLQAQSRAIQTLNQTIERYEKLLMKDLDIEEQRTRIEKIKADIARITGGDEEENEDDGFMEALGASVKEVWADEEV